MEGPGGTGLVVVGRRSRARRRPELAPGPAGQGRGPLAGAVARRARGGAEAGPCPVRGGNAPPTEAGVEARREEGRGGETMRG